MPHRPGLKGSRPVSYGDDLPGVVWFVTMFVGTMRTTEGDILLPGNDWPGLLALLLGAVAWGAAAYRMIPARR